jgi:hypothetical protein
MGNMGKKLLKKLIKLRRPIAFSVQEALDEWVEEGGKDEDASEIVTLAIKSVIRHNIENVKFLEGENEDEEHVFLIVEGKNETISVDVPPSLYYMEDGWEWRVDVGIEIHPSDIVLYKMTDDELVEYDEDEEEENE